MTTTVTTFAHLRKKERRERQHIILAAAEGVYSRKAFETVIMRDIAKGAGIAVSSLYRNFPDQQSLTKRMTPYSPQRVNLPSIFRRFS